MVNKFQKLNNDSPTKLKQSLPANYQYRLFYAIIKRYNFKTNSRFLRIKQFKVQVLYDLFAFIKLLIGHENSDFSNL